MNETIHVYNCPNKTAENVPTELTLQERLYDDDIRAQLYYKDVNTVFLQVPSDYQLTYKNDIPAWLNRFISNRNNFYEFFRQLQPQITDFEVITPSGSVKELIATNSLEQELRSGSYPINRVTFTIEGCTVEWNIDGTFKTDDFTVMQPLMEQFAQIVGY